MRVPQPRLLVGDRGHPAGAGNRGRLLFGYFILAKQEKVTSCRATPGGVDLFAVIHGSIPDETTSHSTKLANDASQVAGYHHERP